jgi:hypothetical protein
VRVQPPVTRPQIYKDRKRAIDRGDKSGFGSDSSQPRYGDRAFSLAAPRILVTVAEAACAPGQYSVDHSNLIQICENAREQGSRAFRSKGKSRQPLVPPDCRSCCAKKVFASKAFAGATKLATSDRMTNMEAITFITKLLGLDL